MSVAGNSVTTGSSAVLDDSGGTESITFSVVPGDEAGVVAAGCEVVGGALEVGIAMGSLASSPPHAATPAIAMAT
jgi:hypothetical protein